MNIYQTIVEKIVTILVPPFAMGIIIGIPISIAIEKILDRE